MEFISVTLALISSCALSVFVILLFIKRLRPHRKTYWKGILISFCVLIFAALIAPKTAETPSADGSSESQSISDTTEEQPKVPVSVETVQTTAEEPVDPDSEPSEPDITPAEPAEPLEASEQTEPAEQPVSAPVSEPTSAPVSEPVPEPSTPSIEITTPKSSGVYVGSVDSDKYHAPRCRFAKEILPENEIWFDSAEEAQNSGYSPCGSCRPK